MMLIEQTTVPVSALPLAEFRDHLRLGTGFSDDELQDGVLENSLRAAMASVEARTGKTLIRRDFLWRTSGWRDADGQALPVAPVTTVISLQIYDRAGVATTIDPANYRLQQDDHRPRLMPSDTTLPSVPVGGEAEVGFQAGFGATWDDIPADLAQAVFLLAAHLYENRQATADAAAPAGVNALIARYRTVRVLGGRAT